MGFKLYSRDAHPPLLMFQCLSRREWDSSPALRREHSAREGFNASVGVSGIQALRWLPLRATNASFNASVGVSGIQAYDRLALPPHGEGFNASVGVSGIQAWRTA